MNNNEPKNVVEQVIAQFSDQIKVVDFLQKHGLASVESINSMDRYHVNTNRQGVIVHAQERLRGTPTSIIIDVKFGQPTTEQVFDLIFRIGKEYSKR